MVKKKEEQIDVDELLEQSDEINLEEINSTEDDDSIEFTKKVPETIPEPIPEAKEPEFHEEVEVPGVETYQEPHPMVNFYNYQLFLESRILHLESNQDKIIEYFQAKLNEEKNE